MGWTQCYNHHPQKHRETGKYGTDTEGAGVDGVQYPCECRLAFQLASRGVMFTVECCTAISHKRFPHVVPDLDKHPTQKRLSASGLGRGDRGDIRVVGAATYYRREWFRNAWWRSSATEHSISVSASPNERPPRGGFSGWIWVTKSFRHAYKTNARHYHIYNIGFHKHAAPVRLFLDRFWQTVRCSMGNSHRCIYIYIRYFLFFLKCSVLRIFRAHNGFR